MERNYSDVADSLRERVKQLMDWLQREAPECLTEQRHLDHGTSERAYWHYGYLTAIRDVLDRWVGVNEASHK